MLVFTSSNLAMAVLITLVLIPLSIIVLCTIAVKLYVNKRWLAIAEMEHKSNSSALSIRQSSSQEMSQRGIGHDMNLNHIIGHGRYGEVWLGTMMGKQYAIKIFTSRHREEWSREMEMYTLPMMNHENILQFFFPEEVDRRDTCAFQSWLCFEYHKNCDLQRYLETNTIDLSTARIMNTSFLTGLHYLHSEIRGRDIKPGKHAGHCSYSFQLSL